MAPDAREPALEHLERERILRPVPSTEPDGVSRREIYHDVLAPAVVDWRRRHVEQQRREESERGLAEAGERARRLEVRNRRLAAAVIALAGVAVALALYLWNPEPVQRAELQTVDARFSVRGAQDPDRGRRWSQWTTGLWLACARRDPDLRSRGSTTPSC